MPTIRAIEETVRPDLLETGIRSTAAALVVSAFLMLLGGHAIVIGWSFRAALEPLLRRIRDGTSHSRAELADASVMAAIVFASFAVLFEHAFVALALVAVLWWGRPLIRLATTEENRMLALGQSFSIDLVIGFYLPIVAAQLLLLNYLIATSMGFVVLALSWPAMGGRPWTRGP